MATEVELAWAAGIIDGEGNVAIYKVNTNWRSPYLRPVIKVAMSDYETLEQLKRIFGRGNVNGPYGNVHPRTGKQEGTLPVWHWTQVARQAAEVATLILPYSVTKRKPLQEILDHYANKDS